MKLSDFDYNLPEELIATKPLESRDESRLLVCDGENISEKIFKDVIDNLNKGDVLVLNDTKVIPARVKGKCLSKDVEITLIKKLSAEGEVWQALAKPAKKLVVGEGFYISERHYAEILDKNISGDITLKFNDAGAEFYKMLGKYGTMPLPPYIEKKRKADDGDKKCYQTIFANDSKENSVAAPTAGLHFTPELLERIKAKGVETAFVTLHVGAGTFFPVRVENILEHKMHSEYFEIGKEAADKINAARKNGGRVVAVGTTSLRTLESAAAENGDIKPSSGETNIFIYPGYRFKIVDALITNFHLPKSTLFMLVCAFMGTERMKKLYSYAIDKKYRFFSYGDASLLIRDKIVS